MKKSLLITGTVLTIALAGCSSNEASQKITDNSTKATAKTGTQQSPAPSTATTTTTAPKQAEDIWTYYNNATWTDNFNGLKLTVEKVVVSDKAPEETDPTKKDASAVGVRFKLENTTQGKFTTYPDQAHLVTSTGEQIDMPTMLGSDHIGGEIDTGVIKEGNVIWYLQRGHASDIKWIKLQFDNHVGGEEQFDGAHKTEEFTINLQ